MDNVLKFIPFFFFVHFDGIIRAGLLCNKRSTADSLVLFLNSQISKLILKCFQVYMVHDEHQALFIKYGVNHKSSKHRYTMISCAFEYVASMFTCFIPYNAAGSPWPCYLLSIVIVSHQSNCLLCPRV